jgi:hypothetical protein
MIDTKSWSNTVKIATEQPPRTTTARTIITATPPKTAYPTPM